MSKTARAHPQSAPESAPPPGVQRQCSIDEIKSHSKLRQNVNFSVRKFDVNMLPSDMLRVYTSLEERFDDEYALLFVFNMVTAMELHRAWNMTLLTSKTLKACCDTIGVRMAWDLGVTRLKFSIEDGEFELHRKVPYDYDSEFQDLFMKIATALYHGHLTVHEALLFQLEAKQGVHTAKSGLFVRTYPGRLVVLPLMSSSCAVIFFGGSEYDAAVAALLGVVTGLIDYGLSSVGGEAGILCDLFIGTVTGATGGLFYRFGGERYCLSAIFLGTMYWFFYGTAFVVGLLEIVAGELETGVTRFMAVSIKTFVLCLMACFGMLLVLPNTAEVWEAQYANCNVIDLGEQWWRIPLYIFCSASVLGQYRFRMEAYWRGLTVQLVAYEVQFQVAQFVNTRAGSSKDNLGVMASNIAGCAAACLTASVLSFFVDEVNRRYYGQLLQRSAHRDETPGLVGDVLYSVISGFVKFVNLIGLGRAEEKEEILLEKKLHELTAEINDPNHPRTEIKLEEHEETLLLDTMVNCESINIWSLLMPAVYQLVPGSMIAKMWFQTIIPPKDGGQDSMFAGLMVTSISLAMGLIIGDAIVMTSVTACSGSWRSKGQQTKEEKAIHADQDPEADASQASARSQEEYL